MQVDTPLPGEKRWIRYADLSPRLRAQIEVDPDYPPPTDAAVLVRGETVLLIDPGNGEDVQRGTGTDG